MSPLVLLRCEIFYKTIFLFETLNVFQTFVVYTFFLMNMSTFNRTIFHFNFTGESILSVSVGNEKLPNMTSQSQIEVSPSPGFTFPALCKALCKLTLF